VAWKTGFSSNSGITEGLIVAQRSTPPFRADHVGAVVTAESSGHGPADRETAEYLRRCGARVTEMRLGELGIHGNGHAMMLERNNADIVIAVTNWITGVLGTVSSERGTR
jgi:hypothetical protein